MLRQIVPEECAITYGLNINLHTMISVLRTTGKSLLAEWGVLRQCSYLVKTTEKEVDRFTKT